MLAWLVGLALTRYLTTPKMFMLIRGSADHCVLCSIVHSRVQTVTERLAEVCTGRSGCVLSVRSCASVFVCLFVCFIDLITLCDVCL